MPQNEFANSSQDAQAKYDIYKSKDPFPEISPALLNSADIQDYIRLTGMIYPFDKQKIKPSTYGLNLLGKIIYWDEKKKRRKIDLKKGDTFILPSNSIAFVTIEQELRIPYYIIVRFNLKISNIYRGILLGTGPIVDPGFCGKLSIPLHNLTNNDYEFTGGETLAWMEFTKISANIRWASAETNIAYGEYKPFEKSGREGRDVEDYLKEAFHGSIESSLPSLTTETKKAVKRAQNALSRFNWIIGFSFVAILGMGATIINILYSDLRDTKNKYEVINTHTEQELKRDSGEISFLKNELDSLKAKKGARNAH